MTKGERDLRRLLKQHPNIRMEHVGKAGYVLIATDGRRYKIGIQTWTRERHKIDRFLNA